MAAGLKTGGRKAGTPNKPKVADAGATSDSPGLPLTRTRTREAPGVAGSPKLPPFRMLPIDSLAPHENNARVHSPAQVEKLAAMISEFGWTNPVLIDGKRGIIAGHGRVLAARKLGLDAVPTIELAHLTAAQRRAYVIADNRSALDASWDDELLRLELGELRDEGFDLSLSGFDAFELAALLDEPEFALPEPGPEPTEAKMITCPACGHGFTH